MRDTDPTEPAGFVLTGRHVLAIVVTAFGIIIAVNVFMATKAVQSFSGLVTKNSYVASQSFDENRAAQEKLGWSADATITGGKLTLRLVDGTGAPVEPAEITAVLGFATTQKQDEVLMLVRDGAGLSAPVSARFQAAVAGNWQLRLDAVAKDGTAFTQVIDVSVAP